MAEPGDILAVALPTLVGVVLVALAALVIRHGSGHRYNLFFAALYTLSGLNSIAQGVDQVADAFNATSPLFPPALFWGILGAFCSFGMLPLLFLFVASFPQPTRWMARAPALGLLALVPSAAVAASFVAASRDEAAAGLFFLLADLFNILGIAVSVAALVLFRRTRQGSPDPVERKQAGYLTIGFLPAFLTGWLVSAIQFGSGIVVAGNQARAAVDVVVHFLSPPAELFAAGAVAFAILKYNILGVKPGFRLGVKSFLVGFVFLLVFLVTQFFENVVLQGQLFAFAGPYGSFILSGVTGIVLFKPIEKVANKTADKLVPRQADAAEVQSRAGEIYQAQCMQVLRDAHVTPREMAFLRTLRAQLGLSDGQARGIEERVEHILHVDAPETGASPGTAQRHLTAAHADLGAAVPQVKRAALAPPAPGAPQKAPKPASPRPAGAAAAPAPRGPPRATAGGAKAAAPQRSATGPKGKA